MNATAVDFDWFLVRKVALSRLVVANRTVLAFLFNPSLPTKWILIISYAYMYKLDIDIISSFRQAYDDFLHHEKAFLPNAMWWKFEI